MKALTRDHFTRPPVFLAILQMGVVLVGVFGTGMAMKVGGFDDDYQPDLLHTTIRNVGGLLLLVPTAWAVISIRLEAKPDSRWTPHWSMASGLLLLAVLVVFFSRTLTSVW
ncbi:hypothetical protein [Luteolibacter sp. LG18]|uniref:hypothetical protein n=1 Tax=Luteolibacter sp. LG18 TaxID=2819286 RepID=UPI002B2D9124|nr:hypothetical protein llg_24310 [Luteolibacter sp. LG18]